jgi:hypothetical protein
MKHGSNMRRGGRPPRNNNGRRFHGHGHQRHHSFESSGPEVKIRGSAQQVLEKYLALARDAAAGGDRISAENYLQHAEHYYRIINFDNANRQANGGNRPPQGGPQGQGQSQGPGQPQPPSAPQPMPIGFEGPSDGGFDPADEGFDSRPGASGSGEGPAQS